MYDDAPLVTLATEGDLNAYLAQQRLMNQPASAACRVCGCTDQTPCPGGCSWAAPGLCDRCAERLLP